MTAFLILPTSGRQNYRGKYPTRPRSISAGATGLHIELNNGLRLWAAPDMIRELPDFAADFAEVVTAALPMTAEQYAALSEAAELLRTRANIAGHGKRAELEARVRAMAAAVPAMPEREAAAPVTGKIARAEQRAANADSFRVIDMTPTWAGILPALRALIENSNPEGRRTAWAELERMAAFADERNAMAGRIEAARQICRETRGGYGADSHGPAIMDSILAALDGERS